MSNEIQGPKLLIVEGSHEESFFNAALKDHLSIFDVQVLPIGSVLNKLRVHPDFVAPSPPPPGPPPFKVGKRIGRSRGRSIARNKNRRLETVPVRSTPTFHGSSHSTSRRTTQAFQSQARPAASG